MNQARELNEPPSNLHIKKLNYFCDKTLKKLNKLYHEKEQSVDNSPCIIVIGLRTAGRGRGISSGMLQEIKQAYKGTPADKAIHNAIAGNDINKLAVNNDSKNNFDTYFSNKVNSKGITNQKSSGRCWLFTGLNVIRAQVIAKYNLPEFETLAELQLLLGPA